VESRHPLEMVAVYDLYGRLLLKHNNLQKEVAEVDVAGLPAGIYLLKVGNNYVTKIVVLP